MSNDNYVFKLQSAVELSSGTTEDVRRSVLDFFEALAQGNPVSRLDVDNRLVLDSSEARTVLDFDPAKRECLIQPELKWLSGDEAKRCRLLKINPAVEVDFTADVMQQLSWVDRKAGILRTNPNWIASMIQELLSDPSKLHVSPLGQRRYRIRELVRFRIRGVIYIASRTKVRLEELKFISALA